MKLSRAAVFLLAFTILAPAALVVVPQGALASDAFCGADASYVPWNVAANEPASPGSNAETGMRVVVYTNGGSTATALLTFVTNDAAYQAAVATRMHGSSGGGDEASDPVLVTFPKPVDVQYAYVDSYALNGSAMIECPTFVNQVYPFRGTPRADSAIVSLHQPASTAALTLPARYATEAATLVQTLPPMSCGAVYKPPHMALLPQSDWSVQDAGASYGTGRIGTTVVLAIGLSPEGKVSFTHVVQSSGNTITDNEALDQAKTENYTAAQFLCTPVVSILFMSYQQK